MGLSLWPAAWAAREPASERGVDLPTSTVGEVGKEVGGPQ